MNLFIAIALPCIFLCVAMAMLFHWKTKNDLQQKNTDKILQLLSEKSDFFQTQIRQSLDNNSNLLNNQLALLTRQVDERLGQGTTLSQESTRQVSDRLDSATKVIGELQNRLGQLSESNNQVIDLAKDIATLNTLLKNPKARGNLGEYFLSETLAALLPRERYEIQYRFKNNEQVDAIVRIGDYLLSIDSKFPLESYARLTNCNNDTDRTLAKRQFCSDVKRHIESISKKYIQPAEGTFDFALMCVPSESVFYEIIVRDDTSPESLHDYAQRKKVVPVSPNSLYAYLGALMYALRGERIQKDAREILAQMKALTIDMGRFAEDFRLIGKHLGNTRNSYEEAEKRLNRYQDRLDKIQNGLLPEEANQTAVPLISSSL